MEKWRNKRDVPELPSSKWVKLSSEVINNNEEVDERKHVLGKDKNSNDIRDSYEQAIEKQHKEIMVQSYLKNIGRDYQKSIGNTF